MKILVTGGTGFLGRRTIEMLLNQGHQLTGLGRNAQIGSELQKLGANFIRADLSDISKLQTACEAQDVVIHCAALSSPWGKKEDFIQSNVEGTQNILRAAIDSKIHRFVHISTPSIYIDSKSRLNIRESDPLPKNSINEYARTKRIAEELVRQSNEQGKISAVILRPQGIFGPHDSAILPRVIQVTRKKGFFPFIGDGENLIDMTYVDNVVHAISLCLKGKGAAATGAFNITNGEPAKNYELIGQILSGLEIPFRWKRIPFSVALNLASALEWTHRHWIQGKEPLLTRYSVLALSQSRTLNIEAAQQQLGYQPLISLESGIQKTIQWWKPRWQL